MGSQQELENGRSQQLDASSSERGREGFVGNEECSTKVPPAAKPGLFQTQTVRGSRETERRLKIRSAE